MYKYKTQKEVIAAALQILERKRVYRSGDPVTSTVFATDLLRLKIYIQNDAHCREHFAVLYLDSQHKVLENEILFSGTIDGATVYPREIARRCLEVGAAAVIIAHNHPSGLLAPSDADRQITTKIKSALGLMDVRLLDHIIVNESTGISFAERGLI